MKIYCVNLIDYDGENFVMGYATTEEKAKKMIELMQSEDGFENYEYQYYWAELDKIIVNDELISV